MVMFGFYCRKCTTELKDDKIKEPSECSEKEIEDFYQKVIDGEQVDPFGLRDKIKRASLLAFHYEENTLVGIAALKRPNETYKKEVFRKAGVSKESDKYNLEIGWAYTTKEYRGRGICSGLIQKLIVASASQNIFATTKTDNLPMQKILKRNGFQKTGKSYQGRTSGYHLQLFARSKKSTFKNHRSRRNVTFKSSLVYTSLLSYREPFSHAFYRFLRSISHANQNACGSRKIVVKISRSPVYEEIPLVYRLKSKSYSLLLIAP